MERMADYLQIPTGYAAGLNGLRWSATNDVVLFGDSHTFAFRAEVFQFLEGFISQRPLIHFAHVLHLMYVLRQGCAPFLGRDLEPLMRAYREAGRRQRNAGVFCAVLCRDVPVALDPPVAIFPGSFEIEVGASEPLAPACPDAPALSPQSFEECVLEALGYFDYEEMLHWFQHGRGPVADAGEDVARAVRLDRPPSLSGVLADLARRQRVSGAVPFVDQLLSTLTLPRRLEQPELPLGGYGDVTTHGHVEQLLPSQFVFDDLEFVRRHAERELLYFRREEPHVHTREELVVLLDQGVRAWGAVRLVLTAALLALGRLAERRRVPFLVTATSVGGAPLDPLQATAGELEELVEASDLSPHPGAALARVVTEETERVRDVVLLTHPRNLVEPDVTAAARQLRPGARLFAVAVDDRGDVQFAALRRGLPVNLSRFHVDLDRTAPPAPAPVDALAPWRGDVEPVPSPFRFGAAADHRPLHFAFDAAGEWLLVASTGGFLHAVRTDGWGFEILPRSLVGGAIVSNLYQVLGVAGGFVAIHHQPNQVVALHYDFHVRKCTSYPFPGSPPAGPPRCFYLRKLHTLVVPGRPKTTCVHLSTGDRARPPAAHENLDSRVWDCPLPVQGQGEPSAPDSHWAWPQVSLDSESGTIRLRNVVPHWETFTPLEDNRPALKGWVLKGADCQGYTLAALVAKKGVAASPLSLRLFRGPAGIPHGVLPHRRVNGSFVLSSDGRQLAREIDRGRVEVRDVMDVTRPPLVTPVGGFHPHQQILIQLGECWLSIRIHNNAHLIRWSDGPVTFQRGGMGPDLAFSVAWDRLSAGGSVAARPGSLPSFLPPDPGDRFVAAAWSNLIAVLDRFGEIALFEQTGQLVCLFFAFRHHIAAWMPDGTCHGPLSLLGRPSTPGACDKIGAALRAAWVRGERTVVC